MLEAPVFGSTEEDMPGSGVVEIGGTLVASGEVRLLMSASALCFEAGFSTRSLLDATFDLEKLETLL